MLLTCGLRLSSSGALQDPVSWILYGLIEGTVGSEEGFVRLSDGGTQTLSAFLKTAFLYEHNHIGYCVLILLGFVALFWSLGAAAFRFINYNSR